MATLNGIFFFTLAIRFASSYLLKREMLKAIAALEMSIINIYIMSAYWENNNGQRLGACVWDGCYGNHFYSPRLYKLHRCSLLIICPSQGAGTPDILVWVTSMRCEMGGDLINLPHRSHTT